MLMATAAEITARSRLLGAGYRTLIALRIPPVFFWMLADHAGSKSVAAAYSGDTLFFLRGNPLLKPDRVLLFTAAGKKGSQTVAAAFFDDTPFLH